MSKQNFCREGDHGQPSIKEVNKMMIKTYIRPCPVRLIGEDLRKANLGDLVAIYPCAFTINLSDSIWLMRCGV